MSSMAKTAREAMKAKAQRLGSSRPLEKVDSSTFVPPELLNADVKTGLRPVSRRAFKKGGKVMGEACEARADRKPRKSGGKAITADSLINRNVKEANELRDGKKHIGGMKKGGAAKRMGREDGGVAVKKIASGVSGLSPADAEKWAKQTKMDDYKNGPGFTVAGPGSNPLDYNKEAQKRGGKVKRKGRDEGGKVDEIGDFIKKDTTPAVAGKGPLTKEQAGVKTGGGTAAERAANAAAFDREQQEHQRNMPQNRKAGGRTKKMMGGPMMGSASGVKDKAFEFQGNPVTPGLKRGGKAKHEDVAADKALIKKMVKPSARTGKADGGEMDAPKASKMVPSDYNEQSADRAIAASNRAGRKIGSKEGKAIKSLLGGWRERVNKYGRKDGGDVERKGRKTGGGVFTGPSYPGKIPGVVPGGRTARATGGKTKGKGKTNINIVIAAGKTPGADAGLLPPGGMPKPPGGIPIPLGAQGGPPQGGAPMPMPVPMPMPAAPPAGGPPMARKAGGRISKVASSYKDMEAGSAGGEGRLQKTDIAKKHKGAPTFKKGGKVYRSYKDMDAGSASGLGRLEKTEIASRKH